MENRLSSLGFVPNGKACTVPFLDQSTFITVAPHESWTNRAAITRHGSMVTRIEGLILIIIVIIANYHLSSPIFWQGETS
jgi:hypothetical protein